MADIRIGHGYDVHRLAENRKLIIGGVEIPHKLGLLGHSDADVLTHAVMDAMLGALALGDIGKHFPDTDERYSAAAFCHRHDPAGGLGARQSGRDCSCTGAEAGTAYSEDAANPQRGNRL